MFVPYWYRTQEGTEVKGRPISEDQSVSVVSRLLFILRFILTHFLFSLSNKCQREADESAAPTDSFVRRTTN